MPDLITLGWNAHFEAAFAPYREQGFEAARVALEYQGLYRVMTERDWIDDSSSCERTRTAAGGDSAKMNYREVVTWD